MYRTSLTLIKTSVVLFYRRIFRVEKMVWRMILWLAMFIIWALRSRWALVLMVVGAIVAVAAPATMSSVMPTAWVERMSTIKDADVL